MNTPRFAVLALACLLSTVSLFSQTKTQKSNALKTVIGTAETDSVQYIERLAAYLFHNKINEYRAAKQLPTLAWDDTLWLASRNHSLWMQANAKLSHDEQTGTKLFTGKSPGDRYTYASAGNGKAAWCGENALYNYSADPGTANQVAETIAQYSLAQWQASPGHNENMLYENAFVEGTAFILDGQQVWATSLFARKPFNSAYEPIAIARPMSDKFNTAAPLPGHSVAVNTPAAPAKPVKKQTTSQMEKSIRTSLLDGMYAGVQSEKALNNAAKSHLTYLSLHKTTGSEEKKGKSRFTGATPQKRVRKASHGMGFFKSLRTRVQELTFTKTYAVDQFDAATVSVEATNQFNTDRDASGNIRSMGMAVQIRKDKTNYKVHIVVLERRSKGKSGGTPSDSAQDKEE
jgi:uncharacterized protein YkwD